MGFAAGTAMYFRRVRLDARVPCDGASSVDGDVDEVPLDEEAKKRATPVATRALAWATLGTLSSASALVGAGWVLWPEETGIHEADRREDEWSTTLDKATFIGPPTGQERCARRRIEAGERSIGK